MREAKELLRIAREVAGASVETGWFGWSASEVTVWAKTRTNSSEVSLRELHVMAKDAGRAIKRLVEDVEKLGAFRLDTEERYSPEGKRIVFVVTTVFRFPAEEVERMNKLRIPEGRP